MKHLAVLMMAGTLAGCASMMESSIPTEAELGAALNGRFQGGHIDAVFARYGPPASNFTASGNVRVYVWNTANTMRFHEPVTTTTTGTIGDPPAYSGRSPIPYSETTTTRQGYNVDMTCLMQVGVLPDGKVDRIGFGGKMGACQKFMP